MLLFLLGAVLTCAAFEVVLQFTDPTNYDRFAVDPTSGLVHNKPNSSFFAYSTCFTNTMVTNSLGFHAPEPPTELKQPNEFRIVITGSSFVEGSSVPVNELLSSVLEQKLNALPGHHYLYKVIPVAFSGNGTYFDILFYLRYGRPLQPDLVININTEYELGRDVPDVPHPPQFDAQGALITGPLPIASQTSLLAKIKDTMRQSKLIMNVYNRYLVLRQNKVEALPGEETQGPKPNAAELASEWALENKLLSTFNTYVTADGAQFMVASWTTHSAATSTADALHTHLSAAASVNNFSYLDMRPSIAAEEKATGQSASWPCDEHWSAAGNSFAAQALFEYLQSHPALLQKQ